MIFCPSPTYRGSSSRYSNFFWSITSSDWHERVAFVPRLDVRSSSPIDPRLLFITSPIDLSNVPGKISVARIAIVGAFFCSENIFGGLFLSSATLSTKVFLVFRNWRASAGLLLKTFWIFDEFRAFEDLAVSRSRCREFFRIRRQIRWPNVHARFRFWSIEVLQMFNGACQWNFGRKLS